MAKKETKKTAGTEVKETGVKKIDALVDMLKKNFGDEGIFHGDAPIKSVEVVSTGSLTLDLTLGVGGYPLGRIVEIYGPEASGKTTLTLHAIAEAQKAGYTCAFIDAEHALDPIYAKAIGVDMKKLILIQPNNGEDALEAAIQIAESGAVQVIVIDSVAALTPKAEIEGEMDQSTMGLMARMMSKAMRKLTGPLAKNNVLAIFINQFRLKIGVMYGDPRTTTGGESLKYYASMRLDVKKGETFKEGDRVIGGTIDVRIKKNKLATPYTECAVPVKYGQGFDVVGDIYTVAKEMGILDVRGAHHYLDGEKFASKKEEALEVLRSDKKMMEKIAKKVREEHKNRMAGKPISKATESDEDSLDAEPMEDDE
jgi:recombination protein RecA